jgi:uncharacterized damage-inducible protein DinB
MLLTDHYRGLARYNTWMNQRLYAVCREVPDVERKRDRGAFFKSLHGTLNHILLADRAWLGRFTHDSAVALSRDASGAVIAIASLAQVLYEDFDQLERERTRTDAAIIVWAEALTPEVLAAPMAYHTSRGEPFEHPLWIAALHVFNHQAHHRGQATTLLAQLGKDVGVTDLAAFLRSENVR